MCVKHYFSRLTAEVHYVDFYLEVVELEMVFENNVTTKSVASKAHSLIYQ